MEAIKIRLRLGDSMGNTDILNVSSNDWGILKYNLHGEKSRIPESLSNLQIGWRGDHRLPETLDDYNTVDDIVKDVIKAIETGVNHHIDTIFAKEK